MGAQVIITPLALDDLRAVVEFIARDNPERAESFGKELLDKAYRLGAQPMIGQRNPAVREIVHGSYRIVYRVRDDPPRVFLVRFWHAARGEPRIVED